ncbi:MAG: ribosomal protein S18-alanine N-acetyltransferase [Gammaproteobacteria bacterium]|nr:ribosomal protein S18-alanine N-acetyltransferase [Gammaproteobacteria bacterium]
MVAVLKSVPVIRSMTERDLPQILTIENESYPFPWTEGIFTDCLRVDYECVLMEVDKAICAYSVFSVAAEECHILNLCVSKTFRGQGLSRSMLEYVFGRAKEMDANFIYLEVRPTNLIAINLYLSFGFEEIARRRQYYPAINGREDALMLARSID